MVTAGGNAEGIRTRRFIISSACSFLTLPIQLPGLLVVLALVPAAARAQTVVPNDFTRPSLTAEDKAFLEDLQHRAFLYFIEHSDPVTGLVHDRARTSGESEYENGASVASIAATGFGLTALCIGAEHGWISREEARKRVFLTLRFFAELAHPEHGWFYHFMDSRTGERVRRCEISSIDTALLLAGVLTARQYFSDDPDIKMLADLIYRRVDFSWMLAGSGYLLEQGWYPEGHFIDFRWDRYREMMILYLLGIASPTHPIPTESWYAWERPWVTYHHFHFVSGDRPLYIHQYSHAWVDFRGRRERRPPHIDWFRNSVTATLADRKYCIRLSRKFHGYSPDVWGITSSDSPSGYVAWGGPPPDSGVDGTVVPSAPTGSLMFTPRESLDALLKMKQLYGDRIYGRYGFADAFNPNTGWIDSDVIGIDMGITLLSAENLVTGDVWKWFMQNQAIPEAMDRVGLKRK